MPRTFVFAAVLSALILATLSAPATAQVPEWISQTGDGPGVTVGSVKTGVIASRAFIASADGRFVTFSIQGSISSMGSLYVRDRWLGETELISVSPDGQDGDYLSQRGTISADGRFVVFQSGAGNLVDDDDNSQWDVFIRDRQLGTTELISRSLGGGGSASGGSLLMTASRDAEVIVFSSYATDLVDADPGVPGPELYAYNRRTGEITMLTLGYDGAGQGVHTFSPFTEISDDGRRVVFLAIGDRVVPGDNNGHYDIFVHDFETGVTSLVSRTPEGRSGQRLAMVPNISADGRYAFFNSLGGDYVAGDTNEDWDIFRLDLDTGEMRIVTTDARGGPAGGYAPSPYGPYAASVDAGGRRVVFTTWLPLDPRDRDDHDDIYVKDMDTGRVFWISTEDIAPADTATFLMRPELDPSGRFLFFTGPFDGPAAGQVFVQNLNTGHRRLLSRMGGEPGDGVSFLAIPHLSSREVFILGTAPLSADDDDDDSDLYAVELPPRRNR
ncbi:MAG: hypothetical protein AAFY88_00175 [Acidobacteriota bacterium]